MKSRIALAVLFLVLPSACASGIEYFQIDELGKEKLGPRPAPAKVTVESDAALKKKGYLIIGWISKEVVIADCRGRDCENFTCPAADGAPADFTGELTRKAADYGGDLIFLKPHKGIEKISDTGYGKCADSALVDAPVYVWRDGQGYLTWRLQDICRSREIIPGYKCASLSEGTVWRYDPALARNISAIERERDRTANERRRLNAEAVRNKEKFAALKKAYEANRRDKREDSDLVMHTVDGIFGRKCGYKDRAGSIAIEPQFTDCLGNFHEGLAAVSLDVKGKRVWGFIDRTGKWVISPVYRQVGNFSEGLASVEEEGGKAGFIDRKGKFVIEPVFDKALEFRDGKAEVWVYLEMGIYDRATGRLYLEK